ncbi:MULTISPECIES: ribosome biogenesis GTPase YlqF [unclassified Coleofasciculus]|uniref:ribosome biogenesis GTPase YlqF n=1 Tax=unclassified Coleofasciculus TaxID=2692782 RepID=UPI0018824438|nr:MULTISPECIES: ribosome biogenesis GTPase YlqF [unclassified Coleofasciculus]MBE9128678.1 ribosome biogenesis GTPase YlqF [Coleofasciculus sp. LEGE 07081]MBE9147152.1 ribosome biogenesis GTPase YlqF [Coleofasciculus sp. LEGE 07092]
MTTPPIQWYPGHIAKAERELKEQLKRVDVVLDVRDARIPLATHHPQMSQWAGSKSRVLVLNRMDAIAPRAKQLWESWFQHQGETPYFTNAQQGQGIREVTRAAQLAEVQVNERRRDRGMQPRPVRAVVVGFPNVGKSALINRLLGRRVVESARRPGVTRQLRWIRISDQIELLDAPGVIPAQLKNQENALKLAICDDIGEASYDNQRVAGAFVELLKDLEDSTKSSLLPNSPLKTRYELDPTPFTGEEYLHALADFRYQGDTERTARQLLNDFRKGLLGTIALELPPS